MQIVKSVLLHHCYDDFRSGSFVTYSAIDNSLAHLTFGIKHYQTSGFLNLISFSRPMRPNHLNDKYYVVEYYPQGNDLKMEYMIIVH